MARGLNKVIELYVGGLSIPQVAEETGMPRSTIRKRLQVAGVLRSRAEGVRNAADQGRLGGGFRGKSRRFTPEHKANIQEARAEWGERNAKGYRINANGYREFTRGPHKGRSEHVVLMEDRLGRPLRPDEVVHHIDGDKLNNLDDNLALCTASGHTRLHRYEDSLSGKERRRSENGSWS